MINLLILTYLDKQNSQIASSSNQKLIDKDSSKVISLPTVLPLELDSSDNNSDTSSPKVYNYIIY